METNQSTDNDDNAKDNIMIPIYTCIYDSIFLRSYKEFDHSCRSPSLSSGLSLRKDYIYAFRLWTLLGSI